MKAGAREPGLTKGDPWRGHAPGPIEGQHRTCQNCGCPLPITALGLRDTCTNPTRSEVIDLMVALRDSLRERQ